MPSPLSDDLRQRVVDAFHRKEGSSRDLAKRFQIAPSTVTKWLQRWTRTGSVTPAPARGGPAPLLDATQLQVLLDAMAEQPDRTLKKVARVMAKPLGKVPSEATICRALKKAGWSRKKKTSTPASETTTGSKPSATSSTTHATTSTPRRSSSSTKRA